MWGHDTGITQIVCNLLFSAFRVLDEHSLICKQKCLAPRDTLILIPQLGFK